MNIEIHRNPATRMNDVYIAGPGPGPMAYATVESGRLEWHKDENVMRGYALPVALSLDDETLEALLDAAADVVKPNRVALEALDDTRGVRDRLLAIVERSTLRPPPSDG